MADVAVLKKSHAHYLGIGEEVAGLEFRITILNFALYVAAFISLLFALLHEFGLTDIGRFHSLVDYAYSVACIGLVLLLRRSPRSYFLIVMVFVVVSLAAFSSALINVVGDEFRLIWFYFAIFVTYILLNERAGIVVTGISLLIVLIAALNFDLQLSSRAMLSGVLGMVVISLLSRTYTQQMLGYESQLSEKNRVLQRNVEELDRALTDAWKANRAKSLFLANMSHEIRTPMNGVLGMVQVLRGTNLDLEQKHYLDVIQRAGSNLLVLIDDLLDISRIESGKLEFDLRPFATFDWVMDVQFVTEPLFEQGAVSYTTEISETLPKWLLGDAQRLTQIVSNLVSNAAKFTESGEVRLIVGGEPEEGKRFRLVVEVVDSGCGIPREKLETIFEPFEQVNPERIANKGVGLGLAISRRLVQAMGGELSAESEPGAGCRFRLALSLPCANSCQENEEDALCCELDRKLRVLLVDDDRINRLAVHTLLHQQGHEVVEAENGALAIELLRQEKFDLVLMDVHMPVLDGVAATQQIRAMAEPVVAGIPIIGLTASVMDDERRYYLEVGMNAVVQKPVVLEQLLQTMFRSIHA